MMIIFELRRFFELIYHKKSYVRVRGFRLCCALAKWDKDNKQKASLGELMKALDDEKAINVRQYLAALHFVILYKTGALGHYRIIYRSA
jgi:hypothetical protein